jgi:hypothetical protein
MLTSMFDVSSSIYQSHLDDQVNLLSRDKREITFNTFATSDSTRSVNNVQLSEEIHRLFLTNSNAISKGNCNIL